jgi:TM2 domain-containing membrane protein YozV
MDTPKVDMFLMANAKYFESYQIPQIREALLKMDDSKWTMIQSISFTDPVVAIIVSIFAGSLGIDRFIIGDTGLGVAKLLTCGGGGVWTIIDWFIIMGRTREKNMEKFRQITYF